MAEDSEKRFHEIMDKLFHAPPKPKVKSSTTTSNSSELSRGSKRPSMASALAAPELKSRGPVTEELRNISGGNVLAPLCRPWDRGDLVKRLATFKSMTWFAKPEVVNAVNCARRGWVNVDMDIIACESCGARLLFSTPSSWAQHQVDKAALVFSLKLNSGHKVHCPWVDNACEEALAQFPPTTTVDLVDNYKKRFARLLQLVALPVISSTAIDYMRNPQLEHFLDGSSTIELGNKSTDASITEYLGDECEAIVLYYQAQKLISLCGWEPRSLPYIVDCKDQEVESTRHRNLSDPSPAVSNGQPPSINVYSSVAADSTDVNEDPTASDVQYDPSSAVLDCRLCGASVGLWAFCTVPRPVEFIRFIGCSEINGENSDAHQTDDISHSGAEVSMTNISSYGNDVGSRERATSTAATDSTSSNGIALNLHLTIAGGPPPAKQNFRPTISLPVVGQNLRTRFSSEFQLKDQQPFKALIGGNNVLRSQEGADISEKEIPNISRPDSSIREVLRPSTVGKSSENASSADAVDPAAGNLSSSQDGSKSITSASGQVVTGNGETPLNGASFMDVAFSGYLQQNQGADTISGKQGDIQEGQGPVKKNIGPSSFGKVLKQLSSAKAMEFDPIRQHRHFCPWVASSGNSSPGWKQTLNALHRQKEFSSPLSSERPSSSLIEVDDPVGSVKKLFTPPSSKRKKFTHGSS